MWAVLMCAVYSVWVVLMLTHRTETPQTPVELGGSVPAEPPPLGEEGLPEIPDIDLRVQSSAEAVAEALKTPQAHRWMAVFSLGEQVGHHHGRDLAAAAEIARMLPAQQQVVFYNGLGHTAPWDIDGMDEQVAAINAEVPENCRDGLWTGIVIRYATLHGDEPEAVVSFAEEFAAVHGVDPVDGVRIGVQLKYRDTPTTALSLLGRYPLAYQSAMAEEIGWRVGSDIGLNPERVLPMASGLSSESQPRFFHGLCRAAWSPAVPLKLLRPLLDGLDPPACAQCIEAVGFALAQLGRSAQEVSVASRKLDDPGMAQMLQAAHQRFEGGAHGWENADLRPPPPPEVP